MQSVATFQTDQAKRHMTTLCKHFARKVPVTSKAQSGHVAFPFGQCDLTADRTGLTLVASAQDPHHLRQVIEIVTSHLERFAFRENPVLDWALRVGDASD